MQFMLQGLAESPRALQGLILSAVKRFFRSFLDEYIITFHTFTIPLIP